MQYFIKEENELFCISRVDISEYVHNPNYRVIIKKFDGAVMVIEIERC